MQYEQAFALLQTGKAPEEALERLNKALEYDPTFGDAYVLKSYVRLEVLPNLDEALAAGKAGRPVCTEEPGFTLYAGIDLRETRAVCGGRSGPCERRWPPIPSYVDVYFTLGRLYADHMKDPKKAVEAFERYLELGGNS